jgi:hypothetical protein
MVCWLYARSKLILTTSRKRLLVCPDQHLFLAGDRKMEMIALLAQRDCNVGSPPITAKMPFHDCGSRRK